MSSTADSIVHRFHLGRRALFGLTASTVLLLGQSSSAVPPVYSGHAPYSVTLEDASGAPLRAFHKDGTTFVLGSAGDRYDVRIENNSARRVEAVLTVDGRDAVSGAPGDFVHARGYIVAPYGSVVVTGFRQSLERAAAFRFASPESSYSARMGTPENVGVIGVAFFPERPVYRPRPLVRAPEPRYRTWQPTEDDEVGHARGASRGSAEAPTASAPRPSAPPAKSAASSADSAAPGSRGRGGAYREARRDAPSRLGTEYGESTWSPVTEVSFNRQSPARPDAVLTLRYDDASGLIARGIEVYPPPYWPQPEYAAPNPFPATNRFAPPPP